MMAANHFLLVEPLQEGGERERSCSIVKKEKK